MSMTTHPQLSTEPLTQALVRPGGLWREVGVVAETGSTNADLLAGGGGASGTVLLAENQTAGRGRQGRSWTSPPGAGLLFSVLLRPGGVNVARWSWLPLLVGEAMATAITRLCVLGVRLKWPNDLVTGPPSAPRKLAGVLAERAEDVIVLGVGLNVTAVGADAPPTATSLTTEGVPWVSRQELLVGTLHEFEGAYRAWLQAGGDPDSCGVRALYRRLSATLEREVRVTLPAGEQVTGTARDIDPTGRLLVETEGGERSVAAGDVVHVR